MNQQQLPWQNAEWLKQAHSWIHSQATNHFIQIIGDIEQPHIRPWSTVLRVPSSDGLLFFKATSAETSHEIALTQKLADQHPNIMPELIATDTAHGWMLMRDGGEPLRASIRPMQDITLWNPAITRYAELQIDLAKSSSDFLALGIPDHRLEVLPTLYAQILTDEETILPNQPKGLTSDELCQLQELAPRFVQVCADLTSFGIPESLNHGDFHDGNVLLKNKRITFFDWGDATVTHPFLSLRTFFVSIEITLDLDEYSFTSEMSALLDLYLAPWQRFASKDRLLTAYRLSRPIASIARAYSWRQAISALNISLREEYAGIVPELLREFLVHEKMLSN